MKTEEQVLNLNCVNSSNDAVPVLEVLTAKCVRTEGSQWKRDKRRIKVTGAVTQSGKYGCSYPFQLMQFYVLNIC